MINKYNKLFEEGNGTIPNMKTANRSTRKHRTSLSENKASAICSQATSWRKIGLSWKQGILKKAEHSSWTIPVVLVLKPDKAIRLYGDYKVSINPWMKAEGYPLPRTFFNTSWWNIVHETWPQTSIPAIGSW